MTFNTNIPGLQVSTVSCGPNTITKVIHTQAVAFSFQKNGTEEKKSTIRYFSLLRMTLIHKVILYRCFLWSFNTSILSSSNYCESGKHMVPRLILGKNQFHHHLGLPKWTFLCFSYSQTEPRTNTTCQFLAFKKITCSAHPITNASFNIKPNYQLKWKVKTKKEKNYTCWASKPQSKI